MSFRVKGLLVRHWEWISAHRLRLVLAASFAVVWGSGALLGSIAGGWAMLGFGPQGLPLSLALVYLLLAIGVTRRQLALARSS